MIAIEPRPVTEQRQPLAGESRRLRRPGEHERDLPVAEHRQPLLATGPQRPVDGVVERPQLRLGEPRLLLAQASASRTMATISSTSVSVTISGGLNWVTE